VIADLNYELNIKERLERLAGKRRPGYKLSWNLDFISFFFYFTCNKNWAL